MTAWTEHAIWWHVYPLSATGAPIRGGDRTPTPRLGTLIPWIDHLVALGCNGLLLGPLFQSTSHGYDTLDHFRIDPRLGDDADFDALVEACRQRGVRILLDGVFSHVGRDHPLLRQALDGGPGSPADALFHVDRSDPQAPRLPVFEGHEALVRLDHGRQAAVDLTARVMTHWLERGIDGWRLDAAYSVSPDFWRRVLDGAGVRERFPQAWFLGEVIHGDYPDFVESSGIDSLTQYELWKAMWSSVLDWNFFELDHALGRHNAFLEHFVPQTFVGNHDVTRVTSRVGVEGALVALSVLMTVGGVPSIWSGDEVGLLGVKEERLGGDDAIRPALPALPSELARLTPEGTRVLRAHQDLIGLRRRHPWLHSARTCTVELSNERMTYMAVAADDSARLTVHLDVSTCPDVRIEDEGGTCLWSLRG
ncbi:alpha-amylase family protein [Schaalia sp. 19OD2882]|uniref:alpha-amylase family protein n=1 Tax=Schaalia sp. 19OD2882 TaxID=2794089 RepID=UPI001C1F14BC|nr:alpha-amylase family protein [Schaalia sp. 19OD2882]QWW19192.1 alpha-amylase family protein [Schaalia sp. 19OD2882]